jgi:hypothetical protein
MFAVTTLEKGEAFEADNGIVWSVVIGVTLTGPAYAYTGHLYHCFHLSLD